MRMLEALAEGEAAPVEMAELAKGACGTTSPSWKKQHHRKVLKLQLRRMRALDQDLAELEADIQEKLKPYQNVSRAGPAPYSLPSRWLFPRVCAIQRFGS
jgi:hypothetical protein